MITVETRQFLLEKVKSVKWKCMEMCVNAGMGHVTSGYSCAEIVVALYYEIMNFDKGNPKATGRDRFLMSKNHGSVIVYPVFADMGWIDESELMTFMKNGSRLGGHSKLSVPGVDYAGGSLGIGLGVGAGLAYGARLSGECWNTFVLIGDGECYEGSIWEAAMFAGHCRLDNLVAIVDRNHLACTDFTENMVMIEPLADKWKAFNWDVIQVNGHDITQVVEGLRQAVESKGKPVCVIADTEKGHGIDFMCNNPFMHGEAPKGKQIAEAFQQLKGRKA